ncbi:MAG: hypothetical protein WBM32_22510 [Crocosphaera sp.]
MGWELTNLKNLNYSNEQQEAVRRLSDRLTNISLDEVEKPMRDFLKGLGRIDRPWLTELEEKGVEQLFLLAEKAEVEMPDLPTDPEEKQRFLHKLKESMAHSRLELPDGTIIE